MQYEFILKKTPESSILWLEYISLVERVDDDKPRDIYRVASALNLDDITGVIKKWGDYETRRGELQPLYMFYRKREELIGNGRLGAKAENKRKVDEVDENIKPKKSRVEESEVSQDVKFDLSTFKSVPVANAGNMIFLENLAVTTTIEDILEVFKPVKHNIKLVWTIDRLEPSEE